MLILTRRIGESIKLNLAENIDPDTTVGELFAEGGLEVAVLGIKGNQARVGIEAPLSIQILRNELSERREACSERQPG